MTVTPAQKKANAAWLKSHPNWNSAASIKKRHDKKAASTTATTHPDIVKTIADVKALHAALFNPATEQAAAKTFAETTIGPESTLTDSAAQSDQTISGVGAEYLKQLAAIQLAGANAATGNVELFKQGAQGAADMAAAQAAGGGGVIQNPNIVPSADALGTTAANTNNILAGQQAAGAKQNVLYHAQNASNLAKAIADRADKVTKLAAQEYESQQNRDSTELSNDLTYALYNTQDTHKTAVANSTIALNKSIAHQKAAAKVIDQGIAKSKNDIARLLANHTITKDQADKVSKMYKAVEDVYNHQNGGKTGGPGTKTWEVTVNEPTRVATGEKTVDDKGNIVPTYKIVLKPVTKKNISDEKYQQFLATGGPGTHDLTALGFQKGSKLVAGTSPIPHVTAGTGTTVQKWTPLQSKQVLIHAGFTAPQVAAIIKTLSQSGTPAGAAAAQALLTQIPLWLKGVANFVTGG